MGVGPHDERFMAAAIRLSRWHTGLTSTNPSVGCLIVRDGVIVGRGVTALGGRPHAEPQALADAAELARGATAYVTLEPCSHHGKTPPCAEALIAYGVARVVIAVTDPDPRVSGRGIALLRAAGIEVDAGLLEEEGRRALAGYLTRQTKNRPYVTLKLAISADGMIGREGGGQVAITGPAARAQVHSLRAETDAILVGIGTAIADDPLLTVRTPGLESQSPIRTVLDPALELPLTSKLVNSARDVPVIVVARPEMDEARAEPLRSAGVEILPCDPYHPEVLLPALASRGISSLLVEGGAKTARLFLDAGLVDRIQLYQGPGTIGEGGIESPLQKTDMPSGFAHRGTFIFGEDRLDEYEREL
ncbi:bifunctional diaminohydroxyphosphoribosylaminopyrimidine deaminase/5-amino-6-(5-phosphoribosylamino)uracil reductase RibD [Rhizobium sp. P32RR-XVIII]|uniref:bifunctional diaminohydroxyphosphoribosylaminopyrimidine deaminase/5-amino-6-(5-phosphoribosylamino)uracil reductase RibD n=1 Tax=Rhizobium sp. P32RR-XVIII TaxID=2726738 RepID=UPI0014578232|nr:bifunctional diaminohydroxyphosphoribosylaminopyrimidine deaminase/5-amino-6-(5-phosphoribosylamino)uracil reductase RibD [Rhizobium sp. P32RR-XVIII]NLS03113.1 bifunctional diaminohydroxyphosphoribosylaminopyrimidine deaminase/5-amino-6-(5-phosphoribosylamino)uracil reductase RibD [Rhizobium sp. P32RR-XVIII]